MKRNLIVVFAAALVAAAAQGAAAGPFDRLAKKFGKVADRGLTAPVAVLPFNALDDSDPREGVVLSEQALSALAERGDVTLVERTALARVLGEHQLAASGAFDSRRAAELGRLLNARAVIVGSFYGKGSRVEVTARLVDVERGTVLAAYAFRVKRGYYSAALSRIPEPEPIDPYAAALEALAFQKGWTLPTPKPAAVKPAPRQVAALPGMTAAGDLRDSLAPAGEGCSAWQARYDVLQERVIALKARYWAAEIRRHALDLGETGERLTRHMGAAELGLRFKRMLTDAVLSEAAALSGEEAARFRAIDGEAFELQFACGRFGV